MRVGQDIKLERLVKPCCVDTECQGKDFVLKTQVRNDLVANHCLFVTALFVNASILARTWDIDGHLGIVRL